LVLTMDQAIQYGVERSVNEAMEKFSAQSAMAVVMNPGTGAVLAMVNVPAFNPNVYQNSDRALWRNRVVTDRYEPGSTMKIFTAAAALESGLCTQDSIFFCENGKYRLGSNTVHDTHEYGWLTLEDIIKVSSNIGATKVGEKIGAAVLYQTLDRFGFGQKTGIDCPGETTGSLAPFQQWRKIDAATISFGQGVSVSAIQLAAAACAIVNDGVLMKPYLVQAVTDQHGRVIKGFKPQVVRRVISAQNAGILRKMMQNVVSEGGTGVNAALEGYSIGGKTGTAQKINPQGGGYERGKYVGSFLGFAPAEKPEIVVLVIIDEPRRFHYGGTVAAPAFRRIVLETLNYLNIPPPGAGERLTVSVGREVRK
ncbi:MAG: penicillin-binding protein 2, partial [Desulfobacterales bacterium]|nr:penicillin-binding protein 2 [Desulfobacterales bacterium]